MNSRAIKAKRNRARHKLATPVLFRVNRETKGTLKPTERPVRIVKWLRLELNADRVYARLKQAKHWREKRGRSENLSSM